MKNTNFIYVNMSTLTVCRMCLARNIKMHVIANTPHQNIYENFSGLMLITEDGKPVTICYICFAMLRKFSKLQEISIKTDLLLKETLCKGIKIAKDKTMHGENIYNLGISATKCLSIPESIKNENPEIKEEILGERISNKIRNEDDSVTVVPKDYDVTLKTSSLKQEQNSPEFDGDLLSTCCLSAMNEIETASKSCNDTRSKRIKLCTTKSLNMGSTANRKKSYACDVCNKLFKQNVNLKRHIKTHTDTKSLACKKCSETFENKYDFQEHNTFHTEMYMCDLCGNSFSSKYSLKIHIIQKHNTGVQTKIHNCDRCNKSFNHRGTLRLHMRTHTGDRPYACENCSKSFSQKATLLRHMRMHTGEKPYACDKCTKTFNQASSLKRHINMHTGDKPYVCKCGKAYYESSHLTRHLRTHTGEKPYACDRCFQTFGQSSNLQAHMRKHTGEKATKYICHECNKTFDHKSIFKRHLLKHTQEKPFPCDRCDKKYADKRTLQRHIVTHNLNN